jgi:hypothetical protein
MKMKSFEKSLGAPTVEKVSSLLALLLAACSGSDQLDSEFDDMDPTELQIDQTTSAIRSGSKSQKVTGHGHTVQVQSNCTGTLLRNDIVLTARHCFSSPYRPTLYTIKTGFDGNTWTEIGNVDSIDVMRDADCTWCPSTWPTDGDIGDDADAAILHLSSPVTLDGVKEGAFRALYPWEDTDANLQGGSVTCEGWGNNVCTGLPAPNDQTGFGQLRYFNTTIDAVQHDENNGRYYINQNASGQQVLSGDSGGSCWLFEDSTSKYRQVLGINKVSGCGSSRSSMILNSTIRPWVRSLLGHYATNFFTTFDDPSELSEWTVMAPPSSTGGPPDWEISGSALREHSDMAGVSPPSVAGTGTHIIRNDQVIANAWIDTKIYSDDDDHAGIMFRYVDERNYYRFVANEYNGGTVKFERIRDGQVATFGEATNVGIDWSTGVKLSVQTRARDHWGYVNDRQVSYMFDKAHPDGRVGLHNRILKDARYIYFAVYHDDNLYPNEN